MRLRRRLGLLLFGVALMLLGEPVTTVFCGRCGRFIDAMCKPHLDELAGTGQRR